ncbi:MAG: hypothetical protein ACLGIR_07500 [Actinomycetes bacterium]
MKASAQSTTYLAVGMLVAGFLLIALAWNGAASVDFVQGQVPFLISGGVAGIGLIIGGVTLTLIQEMRKTTGVLAARLDRIAELLMEVEDVEVETMPAPRARRGESTIITDEELVDA